MGYLQRSTGVFNVYATDTQYNLRNNSDNSRGRNRGYRNM